MLSNIQCLRAVAAYMVVFLHTSLYTARFTGYDIRAPWFGEVTGLWLASGVDLFFVISGFVMVYATHGRQVGTVGFWRDRAIRIVPMYWAATLLLVALNTAGFRPSGFEQQPWRNVVASLLFLPAPNEEGGIAMPPLYPGWTLNYEILFYLAFGACLLAGSTRAAVMRLATVLTLLVGGANLLALAGPDRFWLDFLGNTIVFEFLIGAVVGLAFIRHRAAARNVDPRLCYGAMALALAALVGSETVGHAFDDPWCRWRLLVYGLPAATIVAACLILEAQDRRIRSRWIALQGAASYSIYLFHIIALWAAANVLSAVLAFENVFGAASFALGIVLAAGIAGTVIHLGFEEPALRLLRGVRRTPAPAAPAE